MKSLLNERELLESGHLGCAGCSDAIGLRLVLKAVGEKAIMVVPSCCATLLGGIFPHSAIRIPVLHTPFETAAATAAGIRAALDVQGKEDITVLAWAGDGGTFDIGLQSLSSVAERNEDILYVCYDNEAYMNQGSRSPSGCAVGRGTISTPVDYPQREQKKNIMEIMAAHAVPYCASACIAYPEDLTAKVKKALSIRGFRFLHLISPCPPGWKIAQDRTIQVARLAVESCIFPLYEVEHGELYTISHRPEPIRPVKDYLSHQRRFQHLTERQTDQIQRRVLQEWEKLLKRVECSRDFRWAKRARFSIAQKKALSTPRQESVTEDPGH